MKILFIGNFTKHSTNYQEALEFKKQNHQVILFDYLKTSAFSRKKESEADTKINFNQRKTTLLKASKKLYSSVLNLLEKRKHIGFFDLILDINRFYVHGRWKINRQLLKEVEINDYNIIFMPKTFIINYRLLPKLNKYSNTWYYFMDCFKNARDMNAQRYAALSTWSSATTSDVCALFKKSGANNYWITEGFNPDIFKPSEENQKKEYDVVFIGSRNQRRLAYINYLKKRDIKVAVYGIGWNNYPVYMNELVHIYRKSKIILNITSQEQEVGFSDRIFLAMGTGSFVLSEYVRDLKCFFKKGIHLEWFHAKEELYQLIKTYLANDKKRELMAKRGSKLVHDNFTWDKIIRKITQIINEDLF